MLQSDRASGVHACSGIGSVCTEVQHSGRGAGDLQTTDLGGNGGMEPTAWGNVLTSFCRRSSNSEYLS